MPPRSPQPLIAAIEAAWSGSPYPGDAHIFTPHSYDDEGITDYFRGTTWQGHSAAQLRRMSAAISSFFAPRAFHYWLPAFLIAAIQAPDELSQGVDALLFALSPQGPQDRRAELAERLDLLTEAQLEATIAAIDWIGREVLEDVTGITSLLRNVAAGKAG